jgi:hypothetical protein
LHDVAGLQCPAVLRAEGFEVLDDKVFVTEKGASACMERIPYESAASYFGKASVTEAGYLWLLVCKFIRVELKSSMCTNRN